MIRKLILCLGGIALFSPAFCNRVAAQELKLYPVDEAAKDASFKRFRDRLIGAVKRQDRKFLLSVLHPKIQSVFDGQNDIKEFVSHWKLNSPDSKLWNELRTALSLGGSFDHDNGQKIFIAPYVTSRWDSLEHKLPRDADAFTYSAIIAARVPVYSKPDLASPAVTFLSYDVVEVDLERRILKGDSEDLLWARIRSLKGQEGYVQGDKIRSAVDYRAYFKKVKGKWLLYIFVAGD